MNPKTSNIICEFCQENIITIEHLVFECEPLHEPRQVLFRELLETLDKQELQHLNRLSDRGKLEELIGLKASKSEEINLYLTQIIAEYIYSIKG